MTRRTGLRPRAAPVLLALGALLAACGSSTATPSPTRGTPTASPMTSPTASPSLGGTPWHPRPDTDCWLHGRFGHLHLLSPGRPGPPDGGGETGPGRCAPRG